MTLQDARGLATSSTHRRSLDAFEVALGQFQCYRGNAVATLDAALADDPGFALGHIFRAELHVTLWERGSLAEIESSLEALGKLANACNDRERLHVAAIRDWLGGDWDGFRARLDQLLAEHPRDALALQIGHVADFFQGDRDNLRGRILRALPAWNGEVPGYGFVQGMLAFGLEECGDYRRAEESGRRAIELEPDDCWAQHALAHVMEMEARQAEGMAFMDSRRAHWAQEDNGFAFHNWWHTALYHLDQGEAARALEIYDRSIRPGQSEIQLEMVDATALLWRMHLQGIDTGRRWDSLAAAYEKTAQDGFYAFNDMHAMMAYVATGARSSAERLLAAAERAAETKGSNAHMQREVGVAILRAIEAFGRGAYAECVALLLPVRYRAHVFGGSHAQRDILHRTLIEAALRGNQHALAEALASERTALKPHCPFSWKLRRRAEEGLVGKA